MKNLILLFLVSFLSISEISAQDRVNREKQEFSLSSIKLEQATGWAYNKEEGVWVEYQNIVSDNTYKNYPALKGSSYHKSRESQTFQYLQLKKLVSGGQVFYFLFVDAVKGSYKYPSIREDWEEYNVLTAYIFSETEINKLKNSEQAKPIYSISSGSYDYTNGEEKILNKFQVDFSEGKVKPSSLTYSMKVKKSEDGKSIRFLLPEYDFLGTDFNNNYFEVDIQKFQQLFILN